MSQAPGGGTHTIRFYDSAVARTPDLFSTNLPIASRDVHFVLKNVGTQTVTVRPVFRSATTGVAFLDIPPVQLASGDTQIVDTTMLSARAASDPDFHAVSLQVANPAGANGSLIGSLSSYERQSHLSFELPLRDRGSMRNSVGSYPVRLDGDYTTTVSITNVSEDGAQFTASIKHPRGNYSFVPRSLAPGETAIFNVNELRDAQTADANGDKLPADLTNAQFNWSIFGSRTTAHLIGRSHLVSLNQGVSASFSCPNSCPDSGPYKTINPAVLGAYEGWSQSFTVTADMYNSSGGAGSQWSDVPDWIDWNGNVAHLANNIGYGLVAGNAGATTTPWFFDRWDFDGRDCTESTGDLSLDESMAVDQTPKTVSQTIGPQLALNGGKLQSCAGTGDLTVAENNGDPVPDHAYGYQKCVVYLVKDQSGNTIQKPNQPIQEAFDLKSKCSLAICDRIVSHTDNTFTDNEGKFYDFLAAIVTSSAGLPTGFFYVTQQTLTTTITTGTTTTTITLAKNCLNYTNTGVTVTNITSSGTCP